MIWPFNRRPVEAKPPTVGTHEFLVLSKVEQREWERVPPDIEGMPVMVHWEMFKRVVWPHPDSDDIEVYVRRARR